jgi:hypothetical protein
VLVASLTKAALAMLGASPAQLRAYTKAAWSASAATLSMAPQ